MDNYSIEALTQMFNQDRQRQMTMFGGGGRRGGNGKYDQSFPQQQQRKHQYSHNQAIPPPPLYHLHQFPPAAFQAGHQKSAGFGDVRKYQQKMATNSKASQSQYQQMQQQENGWHRKGTKMTSPLQRLFRFPHTSWPELLASKEEQQQKKLMNGSGKRDGDNEGQTSNGKNGLGRPQYSKYKGLCRKKLVKLFPKKTFKEIFDEKTTIINRKHCRRKLW
jgi:hypothetical protein